MGRYPMENLKRVDEPTTLITDRVSGVPRRAGFFVRAFNGDLGARASEEVRRFIMKTPFNRAIGHTHWLQVPDHKGEPDPEQAPLPEDPAEISRHIKAMCHFLDADFVGICELPDWAWYTHDIKGNEIKTRHKYAVVVVSDQGWETMEASTGDDWIS